MTEEPEELAAIETLDAAGSTGRGGGRRRSQYATRDLTTGSVARNLLFLAWPQFVEGLLSLVDFAADMFWAGRIGARAIAGIGVAQTYTQLAMTGRMGVDIAMQAMVSRAVGAGNLRLANHVALQAFTLSGGFSLLMALIGLVFTEPLLQLMGLSDAVIDQAANYMRIQFVGYGGVAFRMMSGSALQASGDTLTPMKATLLSRAAHIVISPFLIFGWYWFPEFGIAGAALANVVGQILGATWNFYVLLTGTSRLQLTLRGYRPDFPVMARLLRIGWPAIVNSTERSVAQLVLMKLVVPFGDFAVAAFSLTRRVEMIANLGSWGVGRASGIIVGQSLGAEKPERARQTIYWATGYVVTAKAILGALLFIFPEYFVSIFNREPELLGPTVIWVRIQVVAYLFMGTAQVFTQSLQTAGDTMFPMLVTLVGSWLVELPLAWALSTQTGLGQYGVAWGMTLAMIARAVAYLPYFLWAPWTSKRVLQDVRMADERAPSGTERPSRGF